MKRLCILLAAVLIVGCAYTPEPPQISTEPILNWFHVGQTKAEVVTFFASLGFADDLFTWSTRADGFEAVVFPVVFQKGTTPPENLGTFELIFSSDGVIQSGRRLKEGHEQHGGQISSEGAPSAPPNESSP